MMRAETANSVAYRFADFTHAAYERLLALAKARYRFRLFHEFEPGKMDVQGHMVQDLYNEGRIAEINDYCRCDVLDTYFVFLRSAVLLGWITLDQEQEIVGNAKQWIEARCSSSAVYSRYLAEWGSWVNPWRETPPTD